MDENMRFALSIMWLISFFCLVMSSILFIVTWGDYVEFFAWSLGGIIIATVGVVTTSLG